MFGLISGILLSWVMKKYSERWNEKEITTTYKSYKVVTVTSCILYSVGLIVFFIFVTRSEYKAETFFMVLYRLILVIISFISWFTLVIAFYIRGVVRHITGNDIGNTLHIHEYEDKTNNQQNENMDTDIVDQKIDDKETNIHIHANKHNQSEIYENQDVVLRNKEKGPEIISTQMSDKAENLQSKFQDENIDVIPGLQIKESNLENNNDEQQTKLTLQSDNKKMSQEIYE